MSAVCEVDAEGAVDLLARLVDRSLVTVIAPLSGSNRYRMLDSLRAYALEKLREAGENDAARLRFAEHFLRLAETAAQSLPRRDGPVWLQALDAEYDNCRAVLELESLNDAELRLRLAVALLDYWQFRGRFAEARLWLTLLTEAAREKTVSLGRAWARLGYVEWAQADLPAATRHCRRGLALAKRLGDPKGVVEALEQLAQISLDLNDFPGARRRLESAVETARALDDSALMAACLRRLGQLALMEERWDDANSLLTRAVDLARKVDDAEIAAVAAIVLGRLHIRQGRHDLAEGVLAEGLAELRDHGAPRQIAHLLESLAAVAAAVGDDERAARLAGAAAAIFEAAGAGRPDTTLFHAPVVEAWRSAVATKQGKRAWSEGHRMSSRAAIDYALGLKAPTPASPPGAPQPLTKRQLEVARLVASGLTNREIAASLHISERTADGHLEQIRNKLGFSSRVHIAAWYIQNQQTS
jgi:non-specific serine/threonine protein kinase